MRSLKFATLAPILLLGSAGGLYAAGEHQGYLDAVPDITGIVPPPPQKGDPRYEADRKVFRVTRAMLNSARGELATRDVAYTMPDLMRDFSCATGVELSPETTPATYRLLRKADTDTQAANEAAKRTWKRLRPFQIDSGPICQSKTELAKSYDYPSGHTAHGWTVGFVLADLLPRRASAILERARAYGESRIVCGAHNMSAVEASQLGVTISLQQVKADPSFLEDFTAAKQELDRRGATIAADANGPTCRSERALTGTSILADIRAKDGLGRTRSSVRP